jgi:hypothetical protein
MCNDIIISVINLNDNKNSCEYAFTVFYALAYVKMLSIIFWVIRKNFIIMVTANIRGVIILIVIMIAGIMLCLLLFSLWLKNTLNLLTLLF